MDLKTLADCCIGTAEAESGGGYIDSIFYDSGELEEILDMVPGSPKLLIGHKGTGKTVLFKKLENIFRQKGIPAIYLTPSHIISEDPPAETPAVLNSFYYNCLIKAVAIKLGSENNGLLSSEKEILHQIAVSSGDKSPDFIEKTLSVLQQFGGVILQKDLDFVSPINSHSRLSTRRLSKIVANNLCGKKVFFLIIDEPDEVGINGKGGGRIWALLHACRELCQRVSNVRCLVSLRSEIWHLLCEDPSGRKNVDQYSPLVTSLNPSDSVIASIIEKRLRYAAEANGVDIDRRNPYEYFFEGKDTKLPRPATVATRTWEDYLTKQSRGRPRDSIQLIQRLALCAKKNGKNLISGQEVEQCAVSFSESRIKSLCDEYANDFPLAGRIIHEFSNMPFENEAQDIKKFLERKIGEFNPVIRGQKLQGHPDGAFPLWRILHEMGFITPRVSDARQSLGYRHIAYDDDPNFVAHSNWNNMQKVCWEIHPVYRSYLHSLKDDDLHRKRMIQEQKKNQQNTSFARRPRKQKRY